MRALRALAFGAVIGWLLSAACSSGPEPCQVSCTGCCNLANTCQPGTTTLACGAGALQCNRCGAGQCVDHACMGTDGGTPDAGGSGGGTGGGDTSSGGGVGGGGGSGGGSSTGGGAATGGGSATGGGAGFTDPDAGYLTLTFTNCGTFNPCGGNPIGTWAYTSLCIPDSDFQGMIAKADMICGTGSTTFSNKSGWAQGWAGFDGTNAVHYVQGGITFNATITGATCSNPVTCGVIAGQLVSVGLSGNCGVSNNVCICTLSGGVNVNDASTYTIAGHTITLTAVNKTFDFCAGGTKMVLRESTAGSNTREPGFPNAAKR